MSQSGLTEVTSKLRSISANAQSGVVDRVPLLDLLSFLRDVVGVVKDSFEHVRTLLGQCEMITLNQLSPVRAGELKAEIDNLLNRSWWNAQGVCGRLKAIAKEYGFSYPNRGGPQSLAAAPRVHLKDVIDGFPNRPDWEPVLSLLEHHEGEITNIVANELQDLADLLFNAAQNPSNKTDLVRQINTLAHKRIKETRCALVELSQLFQDLVAKSGPAAIRQAFDLREYAAKKIAQSAWINGSFYLVTTLSLVGTLTYAASAVALAIFPLLIIGTLLLLAVIGGLQLRNDDKLSEINLIELIKVTFANLPLIRLFAKKNQNKLSVPPSPPTP